MGKASQILVAVGESFRTASASTFPAVMRIVRFVVMRHSS
jgi:hypothetical protein